MAMADNDHRVEFMRKTPCIQTTTIGAYPKPDYVPIQDWFTAPEGMTTANATLAYEEALTKAGIDAESLFIRAAKEVIEDQVKAGIDVPTDGEVRRENYNHNQCRHLTGFDFDNTDLSYLAQWSLRNRATDHQKRYQGP